MDWPTVRRGFNDEPGFWKTIWTRRPCAREPAAPDTLSPSILISPAVGVSSPMIIRAMVDLPDPLSPARP